VVGGVAAWSGVLGWWWAPLAGVTVTVLRRKSVRRADWVVFGVVFTVAFGVGWQEAQPPEPLVSGPVELSGRLELEFASPWGWSGIVRTPVGRVLVRADAGAGGERVTMVGESDGRTQKVAGRWVRATVTTDSFTEGSGGAVHAVAADRLRSRIIAEIGPERSEARGLLVGFLIGDTGGVGPITTDEMRRSGLSHLVAVSGSNVALFLMGLAVVAAPLAIHPAGRLILVGNGLLVFGVLTRWEPSVVRASAMAMVVTVGRFVGIPLEPVTALALVGGLGVLIDPSLARSVGFQLSVLATAGLLAGARMFPGSGRIRTAFVATIAAQLAVAPLLVVVFGEVPVLSPLANLVAIPLVAAATVLAGIGAALGLGWVIWLAELLTQGFIAIARVAAPWPQLGGLSLAIVIATALAFWKFRRLRPIGIVVGFTALVVSLFPASGAPSTGVVFLDVGQGDSILVRLSGYTVLVDGGPDPAVLAASLSRLGVDRIDLMVATHVHADHVTGLTGMVGRIPIGVIWAAFDPHETPASRRLLEAASIHSVPVERPIAGDSLQVDSATIDVLGPLRRYDSPNDQSIVLLVTFGDTRVLLSGDVETIAQRELQVPGVGILKVPHQGAATSDDGWLRDHAGHLAVISVGNNSFGHPSDRVIEILAESGAEVIRTDQEGDVVLDLAHDPSAK
jgi:competence protein ComEC